MQGLQKERCTIPRITKVLEPIPFKSGVSKTGKPWSLVKVLTDTGEEATIFSPAKEGDEVTLTFNAEYKNYNAELVKPKTQASAQLDRIEAKVDQLLGGKGVGRPIDPLDLDNVPPPEAYDGQAPY